MIENSWENVKKERNRRDIENSKMKPFCIVQNKWQTTNKNLPRGEKEEFNTFSR